MADEILPNLDQIDDFGDDRVKISTFDRYKGRTGFVDRIAIVSPITRAFVHFHGGKGFRCMKKPDQAAADCEACSGIAGDPEQKFGVVVFHYTTDEAGALVTTEGCKGKLKLWIFSESKFVELRELNREWPLMDKGQDQEQCDIRITCEDDKWQRMKYVPTKGAHWKSKPEWYDVVKASTEKAQKRLTSTIGQERSTSEIREILGVAVPVAQTSGAGAGDVDLSDIMDG